MPTKANMVIAKEVVLNVLFIDVRLIIAFKELLFCDTYDLNLLFIETLQNNLLLRPCVYQLFLTIMTNLVAVLKILEWINCS